MKAVDIQPAIRPAVIVLPLLTVGALLAGYCAGARQRVIARIRHREADLLVGKSVDQFH